MSDRDALPRPGAEDRRGPRGSRRSFPVGFVVVFVALWLGGSWLVIGAWLRPVLPGGWAAVAAGWVAMGIPVWTFIRGIRHGVYPSALTRLLVLRPFWYAMLSAPVMATMAVIGGLVGLPFGSSGPAGRWALTIGAVVLSVAMVVGYVGSRRLTVRRLEARMPRLPKALDGLRVVQISDLHVGPHTPRRFLNRVAETVENEQPDLIAVTGDQVDDFARDVDHFNAVFGALRAPLGIFAVAGNHDVYAGWNGVCRGLRDAGYTVLVNEAVVVERGGRRLWIAGTGDPAAAGWPAVASDGAAPDIERTLARVPEDEPVLVLAHNPVLWPALVSRGVDLTLSGHTHYGQFAIPSRNWSMASAFLELGMGSHRRGWSLLYINPGTNYWGIPFRIGTYPEVTVLTLRAARESEAEIIERTEVPQSS